MKEMNFFALNSYYDESDIDNPIKQYYKVEDEIEYNYHFYTKGEISIRANEVRFLNGTVKKFYDSSPMRKKNL